jgi:hypothetical protein
VIEIFKKGDVLPDLPGTDFFQSKTFFNLCESSKSLMPMLFVSSSEGQVKGKLLVVLIRNRILYPKSWFTVCQVIGQPELFVNDLSNEVMNELLHSFIQNVAHKCFYIEIKRVWRNPLSGYKAYRENGFFPIDKIYVQNNFKKSRNVLKQLSSSKQRQANRGFRSGTVISELLSAEEVEEWCLTAQKNLSSRLLSLYPSKSLFFSIYEKVVREQRGTIFLARYKGRIIGSMICVFSGDTMWEWYVFSANKLFHKQYPGVCLAVHALEYCQKHGYLYFNFKDITTPFHHSGVRDFQIQFGGKQRNAKQWRRYKWNWLNKLWSKLYV